MGVELAFRKFPAGDVLPPEPGTYFAKTYS